MDFFDMAAISGAPGVLAAMLAMGGAGHTAVLMHSLRYGWFCSSGLHALFHRSPHFKRCQAILVLCYDLASAGPFLFSHTNTGVRLLPPSCARYHVRRVGLLGVSGGSVSFDSMTRVAAAAAVGIMHVLNNKCELESASVSITARLAQRDDRGVKRRRGKGHDGHFMGFWQKILKHW